MTKKRWVTLELYKERMSFSAGHFTIFSATERERLHGHRYTVGATIVCELPDTDIAFDYTMFKQRIYALCDSLHEYFLLPSESPYLTITPQGEYYQLQFADEQFSLLKKDVKLLPVANITIEGLSQWFLQQLTADTALLTRCLIHKFSVKVFTSPGQCAMTSWER